MNSMRQIALGVALALPGAALAQVCNSNGTDGALIFNTAGVFDLDPVALNLNAAGDNVFHFTSITIGQSTTLRLRANRMRSQRPVVFLVSGAVTIDGVLDLSGALGHSNDDVVNRGPSEPGPGGYPGGAGAKAGDVAQPGAGPGGAGVGATTTAFGCPAAYSAQPSVNNAGFPGHCPTATAIYGNTALQPLVGGSGGSGGKAGTSLPGGGGGAGGGAIRICSDTSISGTFVRINANGGGGGNATAAAGGGLQGGPGSGGAIHLQAPTVGSVFSVTATGGGSQQSDIASNGRIRIDANNVVSTANISPAPLLAPFAAVPLPTPPTVRILSINGVNVATVPKNNPAAPDVTINTAGSVPIVVQTTNVPNGTTARFFISTDAASADIVQTAVVNSNSATLNVALPQGIDRLFVRVTF